jgi:hypothetical protein
MWVGVCLSVVYELVPEKLRTTGVGFYFFIISNIGGNMQTFVPSVQKFLKSSFNLTDIQAFRGALYIFYPGEYVLGSVLFLLTLFVIKYDLKKIERQAKQDESEPVLTTTKEASTTSHDAENININNQMDKEELSYKNRSYIESDD